MRTKSKLVVLLITLISSISIFAGVLTTFAASENSAKSDNSPLYYFINCAEELETPIERGLKLKGSKGSGDRQYGSGTASSDWGYVGTVTKNGEGTESLFNSFVSGTSTYKFDIAAGEYQIALGLNENATYSVNGATNETAAISGKGVKSFNCASANGAITITVNGKLAFIAISEVGSKLLLNAESAKTEIMVYGEPIASKADGYYSDGTKSDVAIDYDNLRADEFNANFSTAKAVGSIAGTEYKVERTVMSMPKDLVYFANSGSMITNSSETNDVYYEYNDVVLNHFDTLKNNVIDQEYSGGAAWGYTPYSASVASSGKPLPQKPNDPYPPSYPFNTLRCSERQPLGIEYTFGDLNGNFNIYVGTRSHWHSRKAIPYINGEERTQFNLDASNRVHVYKNEASKDGKITVKVDGTVALDEGSISFIAIQPASESIAPAPVAPTVENDLKLGDTDFVVKNVTAGSKIQISLTESPYSVIYESKVDTSGDFTVSLNPNKIKGVFKLRVASVTNGGASAFSEFYITDITSFTVSALQATEFTENDVVLKLAATAESNLVKLEMIHNFLISDLPIEEDTAYSGQYHVKENGIYEFKLYSETGSFVSKSIEVKNIDRTNPTINVGIALSGWQDGKIALAFEIKSVADVKNFRIYSKGKLIEKLDSKPAGYLAAEGEYVFIIETASGKNGAQAVSVTSAPKGFTLKEEVIADGKKITLSASEGKKLSTLYAYRLNGDKAERLTVVDYGFNAFYDGAYTLMAVYDDGSVEVSSVNVVTAEAKSGCGSAVLFGNGGGIMIAVIAFVLMGVVLIVKRRKDVR